MSTNTVRGNPDIDNRPPEMLRSTISLWVQRCPSCGYCANQVKIGSPQVGPIIKSKAYLEQLTNDTYPELANSFLCDSMIQEAVGHIADAIWSAINAAWTCDDSVAKEAAFACRERALHLTLRAREQKVSLTRDAGIEHVVIADLLRRTKQFSQVEPMCREGLKLKQKLIPEVRQMLEAQIHFARKQDDEAHNLAEAQTLVDSNQLSSNSVANKTGDENNNPQKWWHFWK
jgi:hypothetical protein